MTYIKIPEEGRETINSVVEVAKEVLVDELVSIYGMGSLGYGGYVNSWSDFDIDIILKDFTSIDFINSMNEIEKTINNMGYERVDVKCYTIESLNNESLPYTYGTRNRAIMLCDSAKLLYGNDISILVNRPTIGSLRIEAINLVTSLLSKKKDWWLSRPVDDTAALLALPARLIFTCKTGKVTHKAEAIDYLMEHFEKEIPSNTWSWIIWSRSCREFPYAQNLPDVLYEDAIKATYKQIEWVKNKLLTMYEVKL